MKHSANGTNPYKGKFVMQPSISVITTTVVCLLLASLLSSAQRGLPHTETASGNVVFRYSAAFRRYAIFAAFGIPILLTALIVAQPPHNSEEATNYLFCYVLFALLGFPLLWETARFRVVVTARGLACISPWRGSFFLRWEDVRELSYSVSMYWFIVRTEDGRVFRISTFVAGMSTFLGLCEQHLPLDALRKAEAGYRMVRRAFPGETGRNKLR